jgi:leucyl aminopeptidase (aminopeptidase T)
MIESESIRQGILGMLSVNLGIKRGESLLVVTDIPTGDDWVRRPGIELDEMTNRSMLAKLVAEIAGENFKECAVEFYPYSSVGKHGTEPGAEVEEKMKRADAVIALTTYSLSHTAARENASRSGARIASMPMFEAEMFHLGGAMAADYIAIREEGGKLLALVDSADAVVLSSQDGTDLRFSLKGRKGIIDDGILTEKKAFGNLPAGEVYTAPLEGTTCGRLVVRRGWHKDLAEDMTIVFEEGSVSRIDGGGAVGDAFREMLSFGDPGEPYASRRNCAELGIGINPNAKRPDNLLEAEKIRGTVHIAIGDSSHMGGSVQADLHQDFVISGPTMLFDGRLVLDRGEITSV